MQTYNFDETVNDDGIVTLSGLPPLAKVAIVVIDPEILSWQTRLDNLRKKIQEIHPLAKMTQEEILLKLRQTRENVYDELYGDRHTN
jgi:hypothetical protein